MYNNQIKSPKRGEEKKTGQLLRNNKVLCYFLPIFPFKEFLKHDAVSHSTSLFNTQRNWESIMPVSSGNHAFQKQSLFRSFVLWHIQHWVQVCFVKFANEFSRPMQRSETTYQKFQQNNNVSDSIFWLCSHSSLKQYNTQKLHYTFVFVKLAAGFQNL